VRKEILEVCRRLHQRNLLAAADGNVSVRLSDDEILFTPSGVNKARIQESDIAVVTLDNKILQGNPSGERLMHLEVYKRCPKAKAVVHAHPPTAIAFTVAHPEWQELPAKCLSEVILALGSVPVAPYARPGTVEMGTVLAPFLPQRRVLLLARHGAISWGEDLEEAYNGMERLEHISIILRNALTMGTLTELPEEEVQVLKEMRKKLGERTL
jgi:L-fuculose-phosphate aldolase